METLTNEQFVANVRQWAEERNLIEGSTPDRQFLKLVEEVGELAEADENNDSSGIKDGFGDIDVVLVIISEQVRDADGVPWFASEPSGLSFPSLLGRLAKSIGKGDSAAVLYFTNATRKKLESLAREGSVDMGKCRAKAWGEIKDRKGRMVAGVFVKDAG